MVPERADVKDLATIERILSEWESHYKELIDEQTNNILHERFNVRRDDIARAVMDRSLDYVKNKNIGSLDGIYSELKTAFFELEKIGARPKYIPDIIAEIKRRKSGERRVGFHPVPEIRIFSEYDWMRIDLRNVWKAKTWKKEKQP